MPRKLSKYYSEEADLFFPSSSSQLVGTGGGEQSAVLKGTVLLKL